MKQNYIHPNDQLCPDTFGPDIQPCRKCGRVGRLRNLCMQCLNALRAHHERHECLWEVQPEDIGKFDKAEVFRMYDSGISCFHIAKQLGIDENSAKWVVDWGRRNGLVSLLPKAQRKKDATVSLRSNRNAAKRAGKDKANHGKQRKYFATRRPAKSNSGGAA